MFSASLPMMIKNIKPCFKHCSGGIWFLNRAYNFQKLSIYYYINYIIYVYKSIYMHLYKHKVYVYIHIYLIKWSLHLEFYYFNRKKILVGTLVTAHLSSCCNAHLVYSNDMY